MNPVRRTLAPKSCSRSSANCGLLEGGLELMSRPKLFSILFTYSILSKHSLIENLRLPKGLSEAHFPGGFV